MSISPDQVAKWQDALEEKAKQRDQCTNVLNNLNAEILQLQGGLAFAKEAVETELPPVEPNTEAEEEEAPPQELG
tara:strand:- start:681 stop:905 length:225 start_codon:yes stop_codon:yes gene_type:complete